MSAGNVIAKVGNELTSALQLREALAGEDEQLILDMIEGSTNLHEALAALVEFEGEQKMLLAGLKSYVADLATRRARLERSVERVRELIAQTMDKAKLKRLRGPTATVYLSAGTRHVRVIDEGLLPPEFFEQPAPVLSVRKLTEAMKEGREFHGAEWSNAAPSLSIRRV